MRQQGLFTLLQAGAKALVHASLYRLQKNDSHTEKSSRQLIGGWVNFLRGEMRNMEHVWWANWELKTADDTDLVAARAGERGA